jgi:hypothetical protein
VGNESQDLWEALLLELCRLGEHDQAKDYLLAAAELGCRPPDLAKLTEICGADRRPSEEENLKTFPEKPSRSSSPGLARQVLELDSLLPQEASPAHGSRWEVPVKPDHPDLALFTALAAQTHLYGVLAQCGAKAARPSEAAGPLQTQCEAVDDHQGQLLRELGRAGYLQKRIHRKLHAKVAHFSDADLVRIGDLCFNQQFAAVESRLAKTGPLRNSPTSPFS